jgi:hypothetical protein
LGSNDSGYTASKIYPCLLAEKPLLAICHERSGVVRLLQEVGGGVCVTFGREGTNITASRVCAQWLDNGMHERMTPLEKGKFERYLERAQAKELTGWWEGLRV